MAHQQVGAASPAAATAALSASSDSKPSRFMPVSRCSAAAGGFGCVARERRPALELRGAADRRREAEGGVVGERVGLRLEPVEHIDARVGLRQQRAQASALADLGDEEDAAAGGVERRRDRLDAEAVAVRP